MEICCAIVFYPLCRRSNWINENTISHITFQKLDHLPYKLNRFEKGIEYINAVGRS